MSVSEIDCLWSRKKKKNSLLDIIPVFIWVVNSRGAVVYANHACSELFRVRISRIYGRKIKELLKPPATGKVMEEAWKRALKYKEPVHLEVVLEMGGKARWVEVFLKRIKAGAGKKTRVLFTAFDVTEYKSNAQELFHLSMHDHLTGLYNRLFFNEELNRLNTLRQYPLSVVVCDVDGLKIVNDVMGHERGDELLKTAASVLQDNFRSCDIVARVGGDEFAVLLPQTAYGSALEICHRLISRLLEYNRKKKGIHLSLSVGVATQNKPVDDIGGLFMQADRNMYRQKVINRENTQEKIFQSIMFILPRKDFLHMKGTELQQQLCLLMGSTLKLAEEELSMLLLLCRVHDIGNILIKDSILFKKEPLDSEEWEEIKLHPEMGYRIAMLWPEISGAAEAILQHHEHWDGSGYPRGMKGKDIKLCARIFALVDSYVSMLAPRPYRRGFSHEEAMEEINRLTGKYFDPELVDIFVSLMEKRPLEQE